MAADLSHRYTHKSFCWFCRAVAQLYYHYLSLAATYKSMIEEGSPNLIDDYYYKICFFLLKTI